MDLHRKMCDWEWHRDCQHKILEDVALLLTYVKYLLLKTTGSEEGAQSHALFVLSYLSLVCRTGRELNLAPDRVVEAFTNTVLAAEHAHSPEMHTQSLVACCLILATITLFLCQLVSVAGKK